MFNCSQKQMTKNEINIKCVTTTHLITRVAHKALYGLGALVRGKQHGDHCHDCGCQGPVQHGCTSFCFFTILLKNTVQVTPYSTAGLN